MQWNETGLRSLEGTDPPETGRRCSSRDMVWCGSGFAHTVFLSQNHLLLLLPSVSLCSLLCWPFAEFIRSSFSPVLGRSFLFRCLQISSFINSSWMRTDALAVLGELQTHRWSNASDSISFVKPWAQGTFSNQQCDQLQNVFRGYRSSVTRDIQEFRKMLSFDCELRGGDSGRA